MTRRVGSLDLEKRKENFAQSGFGAVLFHRIGNNGGRACRKFDARERTDLKVGLYEERRPDSGLNPAEMGRNMLRPYSFGAEGAEGVDLGGTAGW